jgi:hypothetical protein
VDCLGFFRKKHGLLHELVYNFLSLSVRRWCIPRGNTVLLSSVTSLASFGQAGMLTGSRSRTSDSQRALAITWWWLRPPPHFLGWMQQPQHYQKCF